MTTNQTKTITITIPRFLAGALLGFLHAGALNYWMGQENVNELMRAIRVSIREAKQVQDERERTDGETA